MAATTDPRRGSRASLRHATFIDPQTGDRLNRNFTLHDVSNGNGDPATNTRDFADTAHLLDHDDSNVAPPKPPESQLVRAYDNIRRWTRTAKEFAISETGKGVFKCALAYLLGSMSTFVPFLSRLFGHTDSKHLVATITVYFHPARSLGSMLEALVLASLAFCYTATLSVVSMSVAVFFADAVNFIALGHAAVLILFVGGGLGFIAWVKLKRGDPLVNIACSLSCLTLITILTKEGAVQAGDYSFDKISQMLRMLIAGVMSTALVSTCVFPISARTSLKQNMLDVTDALSDMLALITSSFISGDAAELEDDLLSKVSDRHRKSMAKLAQNLKESKYEHYLLGTEHQVAVEAKLANCIQRITQSIGGLRSAAAMQFAVIHHPTNSPNSVPDRSKGPNGNKSSRLMKNTSTDIDPPNGDSSRAFDQNPALTEAGRNLPRHEQPFRSPSQIFDLFMEHLGPSMRSCAFTLKEILDDLPFDSTSGYRVSANPKFKTSLERALELYRNARQDALAAVYDRKDLSRDRPESVEADWEEAAACCGHFSGSLLDVAEDVKKYLITLDEMHLELEEEPTGRSWTWIKFWSRQSAQPQPDPLSSEQDYHPLPHSPEVRNMELRDPIPRPHFHDTGRHSIHSWKQLKKFYFRKLYDSLALFRRDDVKYAIKVGFGAVLYAMPSFITSMRPTYTHWRGEWGLLSYMLVCNMTVGASNTTGYSRILGTAIGAILAILCWNIANENPFVLALFGFGMAYWTAYIIVGKGKGPYGRFIVLTYNLSALYAYSLLMADDDGDDDEEDKSSRPLIAQIAGHRFVAVVTGCIWGLIITRVVWPISAREKLKEGLSLLWLRMGLIWKRDPLSILTDGEHENRYMNLREEFELQGFLSKLQTLVDASKSEFELRGAFPTETYNQILKSTGQMLDAFHTMNVVISKDLQASSGEAALLRATVEERAQLCSRISHLFTVLASSMKLEYPLDKDALPNIEHTRDRLLARIFAYRKDGADKGGTTDEDFGILYTYALVTGQLSLDIQRVLTEVETLFGVLDEEALRLQ